MIALLRLSASCLAALLMQGSLAAAEKLISTIAPNTISVGSNYSGSSVVAFGAIQTDNAAPRAYDVVVIVTGPRQTVIARRKERVVGIWLNKGSRTFADIPSFLGVFANRPLDAIASAETLREQRIGIKSALFAQQNGDENDPYLAELVHIRITEKLYNEQSRAVTFLSPTVFRAEIPLPQSVLIGDYNVEFKLFSNGVAVAQTLSAFNVVKVGVEEYVVKAAADYSLVYGLATTAMALLMGWLASIAFRRD